MMRSLSSSSRSVLAAAGVAVVLQLASFATAQAQVAAPRAEAPSIPVHPVDAAIAEASRQFGVPEHWIRAVMRQESNGEVRAVSTAGAMGLMQVMPGTYAELRARYGLGPDPFAIRDNVLAGTAYLREMHDRYGGVGMLAAYNAGPGRWEAYRAGVRPLPRETIGYLARLGPVLDLGSLPATPMTAGPLRPSPFAAPIFVALSSRSEAVETAQEPAAPRVVLASNATASSSADALFVRRSASDRDAAIAPRTAPSTSAEHAAEAAPPAALPRIEQPSISLFPPRSGGDR